MEQEEGIWAVVPFKQPTRHEEVRAATQAAWIAKVGGRRGQGSSEMQLRGRQNHGDEITGIAEFYEDRDRDEIYAETENQLIRKNRKDLQLAKERLAGKGGSSDNNGGNLQMEIEEDMLKAEIIQIRNERIEEKVKERRCELRDLHEKGIIDLDMEGNQGQRKQWWLEGDEELENVKGKKEANKKGIQEYLPTRKPITYTNLKLYPVPIISTIFDPAQAHSDIAQIKLKTPCPPSDYPAHLQSQTKNKTHSPITTLPQNPIGRTPGESATEHLIENHTFTFYNPNIPKSATKNSRNGSSSLAEITNLEGEGFRREEGKLLGKKKRGEGKKIAKKRITNRFNPYVWKCGDEVQLQQIGLEATFSASCTREDEEMFIDERELVAYPEGPQGRL